MIRRFLPYLLFCLMFPALASAQDAPAPTRLVVRIVPQVVEVDQSVSWKEELSQEVPPGTPVVVNINAYALAIRITVTPFLRDPEYLLVVQGDVRQTNASGTHRSTSLQSLLVPPGETIAYFPLGRPAAQGQHQMVVMISVEQKVE